MLSGALIPVLGWEQGVEGVAGCRWEWWRAVEDAWSLSDERMTGGLETIHQDILSTILHIQLKDNPQISAFIVTSKIAHFSVNSTECKAFKVDVDKAGCISHGRFLIRLI